MKDKFPAAVGVQAKGLLYKRGMTTYEGVQIGPIFSMQLYFEDLLLAGSAIYYKYKVSKNFVLRTRLNFNATDDEANFPEEIDSNRNGKRRNTTELDLYVERYFHDDSFLRFQISKDLVAHHGLYSELFGRLSVLEVLKHKNGYSLLNLGLFALIGHGEKSHNVYLYGDGAASASFNNFEYGISITSPAVIDSFWPTLKVSQFQILGDNLAGSYVDEGKGISVELLAAFKVW